MSRSISISPSNGTSTVDDGLWLLWMITAKINIQFFLKLFNEVAVMISFGNSFHLDAIRLLKKL